MYKPIVSILSFSLLIFTSCTSEQTSESPIKTEPQVNATQENQLEVDGVSVEVVKLLQNASDSPGVTLIDTGKGEKYLARYAIPERSTASGDITMHMKMSMIIDGKELPSFSMPALITPLSVTTGTWKDEWIQITGKYNEVGVISDESISDEVIKAIKSNLSFFPKVSFSYKISRRGKIKEMEFYIPEGVPQQTKQMLEETKKNFDNFFVMVPEERIGNEAKWITTFPPVTINGMKLILKGYYEVTSISPINIAVEVTILNQIPQQILDTNSNPDFRGMTLSVNSEEYFNTGKMQLEFAELFPKSEMNGDSSLTMKMTGGELGASQQVLTVNNNISMKMSPK